MKVTINDISEPKIDDVKRKVFFDVEYTERSFIFFRKKRKSTFCCTILSNIKELVDFYDLVNWRRMNITLGIDNSQGVEIYVESFYRENS